MAMFTQLDATTTSYTSCSRPLFVMGLGMGGTMMPMMAAALATLTDHNIARGSTLMNIVQQVAASMGTALFSVLLTNNLESATSTCDPQASPRTWPGSTRDVFVVATAPRRRPCSSRPPSCRAARPPSALDPVVLAAH